MLNMVDMDLAWDRRRRLNAVASLFALVATLGFSAASGAHADETSGGFVDLPNVRLWVTDSGGTGETGLLLHPKTGTSETRQKQTPALVQAGDPASAFQPPAWW